MKSYYNNKPLDYYNELEKQEIEIYDELYFNSKNFNVDNFKLNFDNIKSRKVSLFNDKDYNLPQNIFVIKNYKGKTLVGRKIRSQLRIENKINAINCSMITAPMLLGVLKKRAKNNRDISIEYYPFTNEEKQIIFNDIKKNRFFDIYYPYKYRDFHTNKEQSSPEEGWSFNPTRKEYTLKINII